GSLEQGDQRGGNPIRIESVHHQRRVPRLARARAEESAQLIFHGSAAPLRLLLKGAKRRELAALLEDDLDALRAERSDELALEIRLASVEAEGFELRAGAW